MDPEALKVINRLNRHGYRSFLVGGCVRDMLLGRRPKDFDVVTSATPAQIRKVFSNSRLIGRRFKIVHVVFRGGKVIEVSTFRSLPEHRFDAATAKKKTNVMMKRDNEFGNSREDAARRDFTINALFFDPRNESLIDYVGGFDDIQNKRIAVIGDVDLSFREDPVRMFRAAKFAALLDFNLDAAVLKGIKKHRDEIQKASPSRMLEEYFKVFRTGKTSLVIKSLAETGLLKSLLPEIWDASGARMDEDFFQTKLGRRLEIADRMLTEREELTANIYLGLLFSDLVSQVFTGRLKNVMEYVKSRLDPVSKRMQLPGRDRDRLIQM
ncbi:MAG: polynucleotide adenylyltransferase PcnB, partial [Spirochaetia bacterium]|nr:polynucleotide adenylyltransferase PcnB [Spirochaetia bacterium]